MKNYQAALKYAMEQTYDLNSNGRPLIRIINEYGNPVELVSGHAPVTGFELVRRMELAHKRIKELESAIATHRRLLADAMQRAEQEDAESIGEDPQ